MRVRSAVALSTSVNIGISVFGATAGILLARALGPEDRGNLAAVMAWFVIALVVAEVGQSAAVTYWAAKEPERRSAFVAAARVVMISAGIVVSVMGMLFSGTLGGGDPELTNAYRVVFLGCLANALGAPIIYAMQAISMVQWNIIRAVQPGLYLVAVLWLFTTNNLTVVGAAAAALISFSGQLIVAWLLGRQSGLRAWMPHRRELNELGRFGAAQSASAIPATLAGQYDRVVLSWTVGAHQLGQYAVAMTVAQLSGPFATAISSVIFPLSAGHQGTEAARIALERRTIWGTGLVTVAVLAVVAAVGVPLVPIVFGAEFAPAAPLIWLLIPAMLLRALNETIAVLLRGRKRPGFAATGQLLSLAIGATMFIVLSPSLGLGAAPLGLGIAEFVAGGANLFFLRKARKIAAVLSSGEEA